MADDLWKNSSYVLNVGQTRAARGFRGPKRAAGERFRAGPARASKILKITGPNGPGSTFFLSYAGRAGAGRYFPRSTIL
jgi:hypothetical protein